MRMTTRRRLLTATTLSQQGRLPTGFKEVQWLQGSGTQYCETDVYPVNNSNFTGIKGNVTILDKVDGKFCIATLWSQSSVSYIYECIYSYGKYLTPQSETYSARFIITDNRNTSTSTYFDFINNVFPINVHYELNKSNVVINQQSYNKPEIITYNASLPLLIGATYNNGNVRVHNNQARIEKFYIYNNNTLLYEFVPCYRTSDNKTGFMKITVADGSTEFFPNLGTDEWIIGPVV